MRTLVATSVFPDAGRTTGKGEIVEDGVLVVLLRSGARVVEGRVAIGATVGATVTAGALL